MTDSTGRFVALLRALRSSRAHAALVAVAFIALSGCGKKGPPLAPYSSAPAAPQDVSIRRKGDKVEIRFRVPTANADGRRPAKVDHVEVYGLTMPGSDHKNTSGTGGREGQRQDQQQRSDDTDGMRGAGGPSRAGGGPSGSGGRESQLPFRKYGTVVSSLLVRKPPEKPKEPKEGEPPPPPPPPRTDPGLDQGDQVLVIDTLTPESLTPVEIPEKESRDSDSKSKSAPGPMLTPPDLGPPLPRPPLRYYAVSGMNGKKKGVMSAAVPVPVTDLPPAPVSPTVTVAEGKINVAIVAADGLRQPVLPYFPSALPAGDATAAAAGATPPPTPGAAPTAAAPTGVPAAPGPAPPARAAVPCTPAPVPGLATPMAAPVAPAAEQPPSEPSAEPQAEPDDETPPPQAPTAPAGAPGVPPAPVPAAPPCAPAGPTLLAAKLLSPFPTPVYGYFVYETAPPDFKPAVKQPGALPEYPVLLTTQPVTAGTWADNRFEVGVERCYSVTTVETLGQIVSESAPTQPVCVKTVDTFPPAAPKNLQAVASEGAISLIWDANTEADLAGYIVLRGVVGSDKMTAVTPTPIKQATYRDAAVKAGVRYAYVVVAVDTATPQNVSPQSNRVEETAR